MHAVKLSPATGHTTWKQPLEDHSIDRLVKRYLKGMRNDSTLQVNQHNEPPLCKMNVSEYYSSAQELGKHYDLFHPVMPISSSVTA
jgi:hypothetical protein